MQTKTCFVISPIGDDGSAIRQHADDFLELLVAPALSPYRFTIVRADKIARPSIISNDIIELVQQADLCLVDLTFHNPNVFYECGRRHETGRPTIQLIKKGELVPFDVAGIRTISYDLSDARSTLVSQNLIKEFVDNLELTTGYGAPSSGASLSSIAGTLSRIERALSTYQNSVSTSPLMNRKDLISMSPRKAFDAAMERGDLESARFVLPRIKTHLPRSRYVSALVDLARAADDPSKSALETMIPELLEQHAYEELKSAVRGLADYYNHTETVSRGIAEVKDVIYGIVNDESHPSEVRAYLVTHLEVLRYMDGAYAEALIDAMRAVQLNPDNPTHHYNLSSTYKALQRYPEAAESAVEFVKHSKSLRPDHITFFKEAMEKAGRLQEVNEHIAGRSVA